MAVRVRPDTPVWGHWALRLSLLLAVSVQAVAAGPSASERWVIERPVDTPLPAALSAAELRALHDEAVASPNRLECLAWLYRAGPDAVATALPFGVSFQRFGAALKLGDAVRRGSELSPDAFDAVARARGSLSAHTYVKDFGQVFHLHGNDFPSEPAAALRLAIGSDRLRVVHERRRCRQANADCRVYSGPARVAWLDRQQLLQPPGSPPTGLERPFDLVVEDMCPATTHGAVEGPWRKARDIGGSTANLINRVAKGILGNPNLREALK